MSGKCGPKKTRNFTFAADERFDNNIGCIREVYSKKSDAEAVRFAASVVACLGRLDGQKEGVVRVAQLDESGNVVKELIIV